MGSKRGPQAAAPSARRREGRLRGAGPQRPHGAGGGGGGELRGGGADAAPGPSNLKNQLRPQKSGIFVIWEWPKMKQERLRRLWSRFPLARVPFWYRFCEPQPCIYGTALPAPTPTNGHGSDKYPPLWLWSCGWVVVV